MANTSAWYFVRDGEKIGPVSSSELMRMARAGELKPTDSTWNESLADWVPASRIRGLFSTPSSAPAAPPLPKPSHSSVATAPIPLPARNAVPASNADEGAIRSDSTSRPTTVQSPPDTAPPVTQTKRSVFGGMGKSLLNAVQDIGQKAQDFRQTLDNAAPNPLISPSAASSIASWASQSVVTNAASPQPSFDIVTASLVSPVSDPSSDSTAAGLKAHLGEELWKQLVGAGLQWDSVVYWTRLRQTRIKEPATGEPARNVANLLKVVSNKVSAAVEQVKVVESNRVLIVTNTAPWFVAGQFGLARNIWPFNPNEFRTLVRINHSKLEIDLEATRPESDVQELAICLDFAADAAPPSGGSPNVLIGNWLQERLPERSDKPFSFPLFLRSSPPARGSFLHPVDTGSPAWVVVDDTGLHWCNEQTSCSIDFTRIVAWREVNEGLEVLAWSEDGVSRLFLSLHARIAVPAELYEPEAENNEAYGLASDETNASDGTTALESSNNLPREEKPNCDGRMNTASLRTVRDAFQEYAAQSRVASPAWAAELSVVPALDESPIPVAVTIIRGKCLAWLGKGNLRDRVFDEDFATYEFPQGRFLRTGEQCFRVDLPLDSINIWRSLCRETETRDKIGNPHGTLAVLEVDGNPQQVVAIARFNDSGQLRLSQGNIDLHVVLLQRLAGESLSWTPLYGQAQVEPHDDVPSIKITAAPNALLALWKRKELQSLKERTAGVKLGALYDEFNRCRTNKFIAGVFGSLIVTHMQLEGDGKLSEFRKQLNEAPPGPLSDDLNSRLVERLSILEIARQQLARWFDRCSLYLPHFWAAQERDLLEATFGDQVMEKSRREREAWRIQQAIRGELRQVQASLGRPLQELGQNLNAISFAFPEEVRCAALASVRNAAGLAEKGAMLTAVGGIGAQLLMGVGRASLGDPVGMAMLGTMGLSLVGKHLQKKAKDADQKLRLRAYGIQALQWWEVIMESTFVMALDCRQSLEQLSRANFDRDKKILESLPRDQLPVVQKRMIAAMRQWLEDDLQSQFYELTPGSGLFGHQLVQRIVASSDSEASMLIRQFGYELPGSSNKE